MMTHTANRLTEADEQTMHRAIAATVNEWRPRPARFTVEHRETLIRVALHAIGCTRADMRDAELFIVASLLGAYEEESTR